MSAWETDSKSDEWYTPPHIFAALGERFDLDVASPAFPSPHVPAEAFICSDSLNRDWRGFLWMNPPFGRRGALEPWLAKFFAHGNGIALTPDRTSAPWFREAWGRSDLVMFLPKVKFLRPDGSEGKQPGNGTALWASGPRAVAALYRARAAGLGILAKPIGEL